MRLKSTLVLTFILAFTIAVSAHDTWLVARQSTVHVGQIVHLDLTSGMAFPTLDYAIKPERIGVARYRLNGKTVELRDFVTGPKSLRLRAKPTASGVATFWVELKPNSLELTEKLVEEYFDEINASAAIREQWAKGGPKKRWREIYTKHAKTFVGVGDASKDTSWSQPVGMALEMLPEKNPTALSSGDDFSIKVFKNGIEFGDFSVGMLCQGDAKAGFQKTDAQGRVTFRLARKGRCLFTATDLRPSSKPNTEWESDFSTLAIEVR